MITKKILGLISVVVVVAIAALASFTRHGVWEREIGTQLIWSPTEAYFFATRQREGWSGNYLELTWEAIRHYLGFAGRRTDRKPWLEVTKITSQGTKHIVVPDTTATPTGVLEDAIYLGEKGTLFKWVDDKLMPVTNEVEARFHRDSEGAGEYKNPNGWSREINIVRGAPGESTYPLVLDGVPVIVTVEQLPERRSVTVKFPDGRATRILDLRTDYSLMDEGSYRRAFSTTLQ